MRIPLTNVDVRIGERTAPGSRSLAAIPTGRETAVETGGGGSTGADGSSFYNDLRAGGWDVSPELAGRMKFLTFHEMSTTDPACRSLLYMYSLPIRAADWGMAPAKDDPDGEPVAAARRDWGAQVFGLEGRHALLDLSWDGWLEQTLLFQKYGSMGEEIVWGDVVEWRDADGDPHLLRPIVRMAPRFPATVVEIDHDPTTGRIRKITQDVPGAQPIPGEKLAWYAMGREGDNWWGTSLLRPTFGAWKLKKGLLIGSAIGMDRFAAGVPIIRHPATAAARRLAAEIARNYRNHERAWITLEGPPPPDGEWSVDIVNGAGTLADPTPLLRHYDQQIAMAGLQQFSSLGTTESGSRAVGDVLSDPYYLAVQSVAKYVAQERARVPLRRLWDVNFGRTIPLPEITVQKIQGRNVAVLARALADLATAGFVFTDRDTQNDVRDIIDLRHLPEPLQRAIGELPDDVGIEDTLVPEEGGSINPTTGLEERISRRVTLRVTEAVRAIFDRDPVPA